MVELGTGMAAVAVALGAKELVVKLLGPTAELAGGQLRDWSEQAQERVAAIFKNAIGKLGHRMDEEGSVPPRALKVVLQDGPFFDDPLATEYFGGLLASSRGPAGRDDRAATLMTLISRLSTYQLRAHYVCYLAVKHAYGSERVCISDPIQRRHTGVFVPLDSLECSMGFDQREKEMRSSLLGHSFFGLDSEDLLDWFQYSLLGHDWGDVPLTETQPGLIFRPSVRGTELFLWAHGKNDLSADDFLPSFNSVSFATIRPPNARKTRL